MNTSQGILDALDIQNLPEEEQQKLLLDLEELVFKGSALRLIERMDDSTRADFDLLMEKNPPEEEIMDFLRTRVSDADSAVEETIAELRSDILAVTGT